MVGGDGGSLHLCLPFHQLFTWRDMTSPWCRAPGSELMFYKTAARAMQGRG